MEGKVVGDDDDFGRLKTETRAMHTQYFIARGFKNANERHENIAAGQGPYRSLGATRSDTEG
jgi:hypothetical protein